jgi:hypothetical protein
MGDKPKKTFKQLLRTSKLHELDDPLELTPPVRRDESDDAFAHAFKESRGRIPRGAFESISPDDTVNFYPVDRLIETANCADADFGEQLTGLSREEKLEKLCDDGYSVAEPLEDEGFLTRMTPENEKIVRAMLSQVDRTDPMLAAALEHFSAKLAR